MAMGFSQKMPLPARAALITSSAWLRAGAAMSYAVDIRSSAVVAVGLDLGYPRSAARRALGREWVGDGCEAGTWDLSRSGQAVEAAHGGRHRSSPADVLCTMKITTFYYGLRTVLMGKGRSKGCAIITSDIYEFINLYNQKVFF